MGDSQERKDQTPAEGAAGGEASPLGRSSEGVIGRDLDRIDRPIDRGQGATERDAEDPGRPEEHPNRP